MKTLVIEKKAVKQNVAAVREKAGAAVIYAVLSADGYGAGLTELAGLLRGEGISRFAVTESAEAAALRKAGFVEEEILMLRSTTDRGELEELIDLGAVCTIGSYDTGVALNALAEARSTVVEAHLQVDIGLGFGGLLAGEPEKILAMYRYLPNVALSGIYTQIRGGRRAPRGAAEQTGLFGKVVAGIHEAGFETGVVHTDGPCPLSLGDGAGPCSVRVGEDFLGRGRRKKDDGLFRVGYGEAPLSEVRWLPKGHMIGEDAPVILKKPTRVAVLPVGYRNGLGVARQREGTLFAALRRWWAGRRVPVRIGGQPANVIGRVGATETVIDVTELKCAVGDLAVFDIDPLYARGFQREYR